MGNKNNPSESQKRSDYLLLIQAKLYGWSGTNADRANRLELSEQTISNLMNGNVEEFGLEKLVAIARKAGNKFPHPEQVVLIHNYIIQDYWGVASQITLHGPSFHTVPHSITNQKID
jgi:hypothetical protein